MNSEFGFDFEYISVSNVDVKDRRQLNKLFNSIEDLCYIYDTKKDSLRQETKEQIERYIIDVSRWTNINKKSFGGYEHKYVDIFKSIQKDLKDIDDRVAELITPVHNLTLYNWLGYFKSSDAFYSIKGNHKSTTNSDGNTQISEFLSSAITKAKRSVKTEKVAGYHLYIISGEASKDYTENATGEYYKQKAEVAINKKDLDVIAPSGKYDGYINKDDEKLLLFATSNEDTTAQDVFGAIKKEPNAKVIFVFAPTFNQKYSYVDTKYNERKAEQHGTSFLKQFADDFNYEELGEFNMLPFMALINNFEVPKNEGLKVTDFLKINPFAYGTDTYAFYKAFRDINEFYEPEKTEKLQQYLVDYLEKITDKLSKINNNFSLTSSTENILLNTKRIILGVFKNFNKSNLGSDLPDDKTLDKLFNIINKYNNVTAKVDTNSPDAKLSSDINDLLLNSIKNRGALVWHLQSRNEGISEVCQIVINEKINYLTEANQGNYYSLFHEEFHIPSEKANKLVSFIKSRQVNSVQNTFSNLDGAANTFFNEHKDKDLYNSIFKFIENKFDFNDPAVRERLRELLSLRNEIDEVEVMGNLSLQEKLSKVFNQLTDRSSYSLNPSLTSFINKIEKAGAKGVHVSELKNTCYNSFYRTNIEYKETGNSYFKNRKTAPKSKAHSDLMEILGLYSFKYGQKPVFTAKMLNDNLDLFLQRKSKPKF